MNALREGLPQVPGRMRALPIDERGYPVPYFVAWVDGKPDHRIMDAEKLPRAVKLGLCWMCGQSLGRFKSFCIGPMCSITRSIFEPPSHLECLQFAARACPWMTRPKAKRREANMPAEVVEPAGEGIRRNPGAVCIWTTLRFKPWRPPGGGVLFEIGDPESTEWYAEGRAATRAEVDESIRTGLHLLRGPAEEEDAENPRRGAVAELERRIVRETACLTGSNGQVEPRCDRAAAGPMDLHPAARRRRQCDGRPCTDRTGAAVKPTVPAKQREPMFALCPYASFAIALLYVVAVIVVTLTL